MIGWLEQHGAAAAQALRRIRQSWTSFLFNALVISAVLCLPFIGLTLLENLLPLSSRLATEPELAIFASPQPAGRDVIGAKIRQVAHASYPAAETAFVSREQALASLKKRTNVGSAIATLGENPLPDTWIVRLPANTDAAFKPDQLQALAAELGRVEGVEKVQLDSEWITRLASLVRILKLSLAGLALALAVVVLAVVFNTVRLQVLTQREEIDVCRLCGATDAWVSRPFYYAGALLGLASATLAFGALFALLPWANQAISQVAGAYGSDFRLVPPAWLQCLALLAGSALLGALGAGLSVRRHLAAPTA